MPRQEVVKAPEVEPPFKWRTQKTEDIESEMGGAVHFSFKLVNSNAKPGGIRLTRAQSLQAPYVSARVLIATSDLALEYPAMSVGRVGVWSNVRALEQGIKVDHVPPAEVMHLSNVIQQTRATGLHTHPAASLLDPRLRQVSIPCGERYLSITPLPCGGLNMLVKQELDRRFPFPSKDDSTDSAKPAKATVPTPYVERRPPYVVFAIGGANPQNVGRLIRSYMQRPFFCPGPMRIPSLYRALAIYRTGIELRFPMSALLLYRKFRDARKIIGGVVLSTADVSEPS